MNRSLQIATPYGSDFSSVSTCVDPDEQGLSLSSSKRGRVTLNGHGYGAVEYEKYTTGEDEQGFETRQMIHFAKVLGEKWACPEPGHNICVSTEDGGHHELSDEDITGWVAALCAGQATTTQPPLSVLLSFVASSSAPTPYAVPNPRSPSATASLSNGRSHSPPGSIHSLQSSVNSASDAAHFPTGLFAQSGPYTPQSPALRAVAPSQTQGRSRERRPRTADSASTSTTSSSGGSAHKPTSRRPSTADALARSSPGIPRSTCVTAPGTIGSGTGSGVRAPNAPSQSSPLKTSSIPATSAAPITTKSSPSRSTPSNNIATPVPTQMGVSHTPIPAQPHPAAPMTRAVWSPYSSFLPSIADADVEEDEDEDEDGQPSPVPNPATATAAHDDGFSIREVIPPAARSTFSIHSLPPQSSHSSFQSDFYYDASGAANGKGPPSISSNGRSGSQQDAHSGDSLNGRSGSLHRGKSSNGAQSRAQGKGGFKAQSSGKGGVKSPLKWLAATSATTIQTATIAKRANAHVARIKKLQKRAASAARGSSGLGWGSSKKSISPGAGLRLGREERERVSEMMGDALEMARQHHPPRIHKLAYTIGRDVQQFLTQALQSEEAYEDGSDAELALLLIQVQICLIPILLTRIGSTDPAAAALAHELITALTRPPPDPSDIESEIADPDMAAVTIRLVARELAHAADPDAVAAAEAAAMAAAAAPPPVKGIWAGAPGSVTPFLNIDSYDEDLEHCTRQHTWLGVDLLRIVEMVVGLRMLTEGEQVAIWELALRRKGQNKIDTKRPWEVALFGLCASQNAWFKDAVLGPTGLESLITALDNMIAPSIPLLDVKWEDVALTLRALAFLSEHDWVARAVEDTIVRSLLGVFRRSIPERWFCIRFWAMDTIRNILSHRPPLVSTLVRENAAVAFATLAPSSSSIPSRIPSSSRSPRSPASSSSSFSPPPGSGSGSGSGSGNTSGAPTKTNPSAGRGHSNIAPKARLRLMEDYKREAGKRAEELTAYIRNWTEWKPYLVKLEPVSIGGTF